MKLERKFLIIGALIALLIIVGKFFTVEQFEIDLGNGFIAKSKGGRLNLEKNMDYIDSIEFEHPIYLYEVADIDNDNKLDLVIVWGNRTVNEKKELVVLTPSDEGWIKRDSLKADMLNPIKLILGDANSDGTMNISLIAWKKTQFHNMYARRPFMYKFENGEILPWWKGSRLSHPFEDFIYFDIDGDGANNLIAIEYLRDNSQIIHYYVWRGFGFDSLGQSREKYQNLKEFKIEDEKLYVYGKGGKREVIFKDKEIILSKYK